MKPNFFLNRIHHKPCMVILITILFTLAQCADDPDSNTVEVTDVTARLADNISTVIIVEWDTSVPCTDRIEFGVDNSFSRSTKMTTAKTTHHRALLLGLPADSVVRYRIVVSDGENETVSAPHSITTGSLPTFLPELAAEGRGPDGFTFVPVISAVNETAVVTVIDAEGRIVWYHEDKRDLDIYRARLSRDKRSILYNAASVSGSPSEDSQLMRVSLDGSQVTGIPVPLLAHDFVELEDGTLASIAAEYRTVENTEIMGNQIVEVSAEGTVTPVWSAWNCFDPASDVGDTTDNGWTFANALDYDPIEDAYYVGFLNFSSIAKIDRKTGQCLWVFGSTAETISFEDGAPRFRHQHQFQVLPGGILVFDNDGALGTESRVIEYAFDFSSNTAHEVWQYTATPSVFTFVLGEAIRLDNGDTFINWSASGQMNLVSPNGSPTYQLSLPMGNVFGFHTLEANLY